MLGNVRQSGRRARYACRSAALRSRAADRFSVAVQVELRSRASRRGLACIHQYLVAIAGAVEKEKSAAAQAGGVRFDHSQGRRNGDRGIEGIAAAREDLVTRSSGKRMRGSDCRIFLLRNGAGEK